MLDKIRIGIIGMGRMGITHYSIINSRSDIEIVAVADTSQIVLSMMKKYIKGIEVYKDYKELIKSGLVDALLICTPPNLNIEILNMALSYKLHAFVEKPYALDLVGGLEISASYEKAGLVNQVGYVNRFNDVFQTTRDYIAQGLIGEVYRFRSEMFSCTISQPDDGSGWRGSRISGGGALYEMGAHAIDLISFLIGKPTGISGSALDKVYSRNVEDVVSSTFHYNQNMTGTLFVNWRDHSYRKPTNKMEIIGMKGKLLADQHSLKIFMNEANDDFGFRKGWNTKYITDIFKPVPFYVRGNEFTRQLYHFVDCIVNNKPQDTVCKFLDGNNTLEVIDMIYNDAQGKEPNSSPIKKI
mgnify:CR=1 FL=1